MKSRMLISMLVIALAAAVIGGATMAWFTDSAEVNDVTFTAGTLMIDIENFEPVTGDVNLGILNPGDTWEYEFDVKNSGTKSFNWGIYACWKDFCGEDNEELGLPDGYGTKGLSEVIEWTVYADYGDDAGEQLIASGVLPENGPIGMEMDALNAGSDPVHFRVVAELPTAADNAYQGSTMEIAFGVQAWQTTNSAPGYDMNGEGIDTCAWLFGTGGDEQSI